MSVNGKFKDITYGDLVAVADRFAIGTAPQVIVEVRSGVKRFAEFAEHAGVPEKETRDRERQLLFLPKRSRKAS